MSKLDELIQQYCPDGVEYYALNTVCNVYDGTHQTPKYTDSGIKFASVENIANPYATKKFISLSDYEKYKVKPQRNDLLMTRIGSVGVCTVLERDEPLAYYVSLALLRPNNNVLNSRYLKYAIESLHCRKELRKRTLINAVPIKINMGDIGKISVPLPPLEVQSEIVRILDNFTELTARKKQYEFYLDKLLTFGDVRGGGQQAKLYGSHWLRLQTFQLGRATPMMRLRAVVIHFLFVLSSHLLKMNMNMTKRRLSPQETA